MNIHAGGHVGSQSRKRDRAQHRPRAILKKIGHNGDVFEMCVCVCVGGGGGGSRRRRKEKKSRWVMKSKSKARSECKNKK